MLIQTINQTKSTVRLTQVMSGYLHVIASVPHQMSLAIL